MREGGRGVLIVFVGVAAAGIGVNAVRCVHRAREKGKGGEGCTPAKGRCKGQKEGRALL